MSWGEGVQVGVSINIIDLVTFGTDNSDVTPTGHLLLEDGSALLLEDGGFILLE